MVNSSKSQIGEVLKSPSDYQQHKSEHCTYGHGHDMPWPWPPWPRHGQEATLGRRAATLGRRLKTRRGSKVQTLTEKGRDASLFRDTPPEGRAPQKRGTPRATRGSRQKFGLGLRPNF